MKDMQVVILLGGKATRLQPLSYNLPKGILSYKNKPFILNMLFEFRKSEINDFTFVCNENNVELVKDFISVSNNIDAKYIIQKNINGPLGALISTKDSITKPTIILLGDTFCNTDFLYDEDFIAYKEIESEFSNFCMLSCDEENNIIKFLNKPKGACPTNKAIIGLYFFKDFKLLKKLLSKTYAEKDELELHYLFEKYKTYHNIKAKKCKFWQDSGSVKNYAEIFKNQFKNLKIKNNYAEKKVCEQEKSYYKNLEIFNNSNKFYPQIYSIDDTLKLEFLDNLTIGEYFYYYPTQNKEDIFLTLLKTLQEMHKIGCKDTKYYNPLISNKNALSKQIDYYKNLFNIVINDNFIDNNAKNFERFENIVKNIKIGQIHNNALFFNLIYKIRTNEIKFISPKDFYFTIGDTNLDFAFLRLCYHAKFELIKNNEFVDDNIFGFEFPIKKFDDILKDFCNIENVRFVEGLIGYNLSKDFNAKQKELLFKKLKECFLWKYWFCRRQ